MLPELLQQEDVKTIVAKCLEESCGDIVGFLFLKKKREKKRERQEKRRKKERVLCQRERETEREGERELS